MKFCPKKYFDINTNTSTHYASLRDIENFHGSIFYEQFKEFIKHKPIQNFGADKGYFYVDYELCARQTHSFLLLE